MTTARTRYLLRNTTVCGLLLLTTPTIHADSLTVYHGQGMDTNLPDFPGRVVKRDLQFEESYFVGIGYIASLPTPSAITTLGGWLGASYVDSGVEVNGVKHHGLQDNYETNIAYRVQLPPAVLSSLAIRFGASIGLSYAWGTPSYEDGSYDHPERRYRLQNYHAYELEWSHVNHPELSFVTRIHHRSGMYGLIAPPHVGSNFLAVGLRYTF